MERFALYSFERKFGRKRRPLIKCLTLLLVFSLTLLYPGCGQKTSSGINPVADGSVWNPGDPPPPPPTCPAGGDSDFDGMCDSDEPPECVGIADCSGNGIEDGMDVGTAKAAGGGSAGNGNFFHKMSPLFIALAAYVGLSMAVRAGDDDECVGTLQSVCFEPSEVKPDWSTLKMTVNTKIANFDGKVFFTYEAEANSEWFDAILGKIFGFGGEGTLGSAPGKMKARIKIRTPFNFDSSTTGGKTGRLAFNNKWGKIVNVITKPGLEGGCSEGNSDASAWGAEIDIGGDKHCIPLDSSLAAAVAGPGGQATASDDQNWALFFPEDSCDTPDPGSQTIILEDDPKQLLANLGKSRSLTSASLDTMNSIFAGELDPDSSIYSQSAQDETLQILPGTGAELSWFLADFEPGQPTLGVGGKGKCKYEGTPPSP